MARLSTVTGLFFVALIHVTMSISVQEFFPEIKNNLTKITWAHAVNSKAELNKALASSDVMMIEADVIKGTFKYENGSVGVGPVLGHPPKNESDITLQECLMMVFAQQNKTKGLKLDFKSIEALQMSMSILSQYPNPKVPVWLNADILKGPLNATDDPKPVDAKQFFASVAELQPKMEPVLSIGWTTRYEDTPQNVTSGKYTSDQIKEMVNLVKQSLEKRNTSVTYPVRACYAANDIEVMKTLLADTPAANNPTLSIWSSKGDKVDADKLSELVNKIGVDKVFVDVPQELMQKLRFNSAFAAKSSLFVVLASMIALFTARLL